MKMQKLALEERPRERLSLYGVKSLSNSELIAILLRSGSKRKNAIELSRDLLRKHKLRDFNVISHQELERTAGIGFSKACALIAAAELGRRSQRYDLGNGETINTPRKAFQALSSDLQHTTQEKFFALFLNTRDRLLHKKVLFIGTIDKQLVSAREIIKEALDVGASKVIVGHNHPSGDLSPSETDKITTQQLKEALSLSHIDLIDHIIICNREYLSFKSKGLI
jgi:DNA repair protein RadC